MSVKEQIRPTVEGPLAALGLLVEDVAVTPAGRRRLVRVWIDRLLETDESEVTEPTPSLSLDEVADATRVVSDALDASDVMGEQPYTLEVTSPGVDRPLTEPRHFQRNVSRLVTLTPVEGEPVTGRIVRAGQDDVTLEVPAVKKQPARREDFRYADVTRAVVQVEFSRGKDGAAADEHEHEDEHGDGHDTARSDSTDSSTHSSTE
jgi:ribosome maturation factor RimP